MENTKEAAEMLEEITKELSENFDKLNTLIDTLELDGTEDTTALEDNLKCLRGLIKQNEKTAVYIRDTSV